MGLGSFLIVLAIGGALLAFWTAIRFPGIAPRTPLGTLLHLAAAAILAITAAPFLTLGVTAIGPVAATICIALPALVYVFLSGAWLLMWARRDLTGPTL
jgi:type III secretory pathway component EscR